MGGTGDAGVVVAHGLLAAPLELVVSEIERLLDHAAQIGLDGQLIRGGGLTMRAVRIMPSPSSS